MLYNRRSDLFKTIPVLSCVFSVTAIGVHIPFSVECDIFSLLTMIQIQISDQTLYHMKQYFNMKITLVLLLIFNKQEINKSLKKT